MKTKAHYTGMLSRQGVGSCFHLVKGEIRLYCKSPMRPPEALIGLAADQSRLNMNDRLTYDSKARPILSPAVQCQATRSYPKHLLTRLKASQGRPHYLARKNHQGNVSSLYSKYHHYLRCRHALIRKMNLHRPSSETSPMVPLCLRNRSSVSCQTRRCSFKPQRLHHHQGRLSQSEVKTHRIGQLHHRQR